MYRLLLQRLTILLIYSELNDFLFPNGIKNVPDILAIGIQEAMPEKTEWEICIQEALGPSHILFHSTSLGKSDVMNIFYVKSFLINYFRNSPSLYISSARSYMVLFFT